MQTNDKNIVLKNIKKIYNTYITEEQIKKINNLNENIKDELIKQIDFLQKDILSITELIKHLNIKKAYTILEKDYFIIKSDLSAKIKKYEQLVRERNNLTKVNQLLNNNMKINELSNINEDIIKRNISYDKYNFNSTIFQMKQNLPLTNDIIINKKSNEFRVSIDKKN